ncbi:MAG: hypothetical protein ACLFPQ_03990 [Candidatus Woesearchaeota archaeon]
MILIEEDDSGLLVLIDHFPCQTDFLGDYSEPQHRIYLLGLVTQDEAREHAINTIMSEVMYLDITRDNPLPRFKLKDDSFPL